jgi:hypothetical protein
VKVLNNLVTELRHVHNVIAPQTRLQFTNPRDGWVFFTSTCQPGGGNIAISLPELKELPVVIARDAASTGLAEGFRHLPAGKHELLIECRGGAKIADLAVRAVPEIGFCQVDCGPQIAGYGPADWAFYQKYILPNINLAVSNGAATEKDRWQWWHDQGKRWVLETGLPGLGKPEGVTADAVLQQWRQSPAFTDPNLTGMIVDEFGAGDEPIWAAWHGALEGLQADPQFAGKVFYPYCGPLYGAKASHAFERTVFDAGWAAALERYFPEQHTEADAQAYVQASLTDVAKEWQKADPDVIPHLLLVMGIFAGSNETLDIDPAVNYHAYLDVQFNTIANDPTFFGLYGLTSYLSAYSDEETIRWVGRAYRHYCLEGHTDRMDTEYELHHVQNPDFEQGLDGWQVSAADPDSITTGDMSGLSWLQGRYPPTSRGNTYLLMRRSDKRANAVTQTVRGLKPGKVYSVRLISADYDDLSGGVSAVKDPGLRLELTNVEILPQRTFNQPFRSCYSHLSGKFTTDKPAWFNLQNILFRAKGKEAQLTITDWPGGKPGGPVGQRSLGNFVELQPYELEK